MAALARYHRSMIVGADHVPATGGALVVGTHSLATYEIFLVTCFSEQVAGRPTAIVVDDLMFRLPVIGGALAELGFLRGDRARTIELLRGGALIGVAPGGMRESLRPSSQRYRYPWGHRRGYAVVASAAGVPIVPLVCPAADDIFTVHDSALTRAAYARLRLPVPVFHGRWGAPIPRPVPLVFWMGAPIYPEVAPDQATDADVDRLRERVTTAVADLSARAVAVGTALAGHAARPLGWA